LASSLSASTWPRARAGGDAQATQHVASWQVKALVEATPISGPASVGMMTSALARDGRLVGR
jgi:hypothetical protein